MPIKSFLVQTAYAVVSALILLTVACADEPEPQPPTTVWQAHGLSIYTTKDGGSDWSLSGRFLCFSGLSATYCASQQSYICAGDNGNVFRATPQLFSFFDSISVWPDPTAFMSVSACDSSGVIMMVDDQNHIVRSTDGGIHWTNLGFFGGTNTMSDINIEQYPFGYICGEYGLVLRTQDGGLTWSSPVDTLNPIGLSLSGITYTPSGDTVVASSTFGSCFRSFDGGIHWSQQAVGSGQGYTAVSFLDPHTLLMVGSDGTGSGGSIWRSTDAGGSWTQITPSFTFHFLEDICTTTGAVYAVGKEGTVIKSTDAGLTWTLMTAPGDDPNSALIYAGAFANADTGMVAFYE